MSQTAGDLFPKTSRVEMRSEYVYLSCSHRTLIAEESRSGQERNGHIAYSTEIDVSHLAGTTILTVTILTVTIFTRSRDRTFISANIMRRL